jgi:hypothetical protein
MATDQTIVNAVLDRIAVALERIAAAIEGTTVVVETIQGTPVGDESEDN